MLVTGREDTANHGRSPSHMTVSFSKPEELRVMKVLEVEKQQFPAPNQRGGYEVYEVFVVIGQFGRASIAISDFPGFCRSSDMTLVVMPL